MEKIKLGLVGVGHLGKIHLRLMREVADFDVTGIYDADSSRAAAAAQEFGVPVFESLESLIAASDAVDIVTPTSTHFEVARQVLRSTRHLFIEKPLTASVDEARMLESLSKEAGVIAQVGHVERFNPAFLALDRSTIQPMFIEAHRLAQWNPRGADVSVVLDLMIHDIDIVLCLVKSSIKRVSAGGVAVVSETPDIANARIEFHNGCVANLTASRISMKNMRKMRIFQKNAYYAVDFLDKKTEVYHVHAHEPEGKPSVSFEDGARKKYLTIENPDVLPVNSIKMELESFATAIKTGKTPPVTFHDGYEALQTAQQIIEKITPYAN